MVSPPFAEVFALQETQAIRLASQPEFSREMGHAHARDAVLDARGRTVRCTPTRRTSMSELADGVKVFRKLRTVRGAAREWFWLGELSRLGFSVPKRLFLARSGGLSVVCVLGVSGRPMDAWLTEAARKDETKEAAVRYCVEVVAPLVRRLHDQGLVYRDLYWNHLFAPVCEPGAPPPTFVDVERVKRIIGLRRRWVVKDLAGLLSSLPAGYSSAAKLRFLRSYGMSRGWQSFARSVLRKAAKIRAHRPRFG